MKLNRIQIKNFRSIKSCDVRLDDICALVGKNNSGKSSILRALNCFFNYQDEREFFINKRHQYSTRSHPKIILYFEDLPLKIKRLNENLDTLVLQFTYSPRDEKRKISRKNSKNKFVSAIFKNNKGRRINLLNSVKLVFDYIFIPPIRDVNQLKKTEESLLQELMLLFFKKATKNRDDYSPKVKKTADYFQNHALKDISNELGEYYSIKHNFNFTIEYNKNLDYSLMLQDIDIKILDRGASHSIQECGSGLQSLTIIALYRFLAELKGKKVIIGIEEPESNLHPQAQKEFIKTFRGKSSLNESQIIFTTHSSTIIDELSHAEVLLCRKISDISRGFRTELYQLPDNFWRKYDIEEFKYYKYHKYSNSDFFFSEKVVIAESKIDAEVIKVLLDQKNVDVDSEETAIINLEGVNNLKYPYFLLKELGFPIFTILDKDYFLPYMNGSLKESRDSVGFPKYLYEYKNGCLINNFVRRKENRDKILDFFKCNHSKALSILAKYNLICFKNTLEMDLIASTKGAELFYEKLKVSKVQHNKRELLVNRKKQIKEAENIIYVVKNMPHQNLPNSYKRIKNTLVSFVKKRT